jgi:hypothetical protein
VEVGFFHHELLFLDSLQGQGGGVHRGFRVDRYRVIDVPDNRRFQYFDRKQWHNRCCERG